MIPGIRLATEEEVKSIAEKADLTANTAVWAWPNEKGPADLAVIRTCTEADPVVFSEASGSQRRIFFIWSLMNMLRALGQREIYFDVDAEGKEDFIQVLEKMGAEKTTAKPQFRFKVVL